MCSLLRGFYSLVYPRVCRLCDGVRVQAPSWWCESCLEELWQTQPVSETAPVCPDVSLNAGQPLGGNLLLMAIGPYEGRWRQEIRQFKFHGDIELGRAMGHVLWSRIVRRFTAEQRTVPKASDWVIIGAPSSPSRNAGRGFEPGEILAQGLSLASGISVQSGFLRRLEGLAQRDAPARNRVENAQLIQPACDQWTHWPDWAKCVILVDDVATTMASMHRMADILYASGIETVVGAVAGRTPLTLVDPPA